MKHLRFSFFALVILVLPFTACDGERIDNVTYQIIQAKYTSYSSIEIENEYFSNKEYWDDITFDFIRGSEPLVK